MPTARRNFDALVALSSSPRLGLLASLRALARRNKWDSSVSAV